MVLNNCGFRLLLGPEHQLRSNCLFQEPQAPSGQVLLAVPRPFLCLWEEQHLQPLWQLSGGESRVQGKVLKCGDFSGTGLGPSGGCGVD